MNLKNNMTNEGSIGIKILYTIENVLYTIQHINILLQRKKLKSIQK